MSRSAEPSTAWWSRSGQRSAGRPPTGLVERVARLLPGRRDYATLPRTWRDDLVAGLTVAVVALPLALGFGVATGLGARAGLITAVVAGLVAAVFGGSNVQVSGPTGAMTVVLVPIVARYGASAVFTVGLMAGVLVVLAGAAGFGRYLAYVPWPVIEGFTVGIAGTIFLQEVPPALGVPKPHGQNVVAVAVRCFAHLRLIRAQDIALVVLVAAIMIVVPRLHRAAPASLIAVVAATVVGQLAHLRVAVIGRLPSALPTPALPALGLHRMTALAGAAGAVAILAALESLMSARVADGMAGGPRHDPDRELVGQGLANIVSPLFGGLPATGAIARTAVNVRSGARSRVAAAIHALALALVVAFGASLVSRIPLAALAAVLMVTASRMVEAHNVRAVTRSTAGDALVLVLTAAATLAFDLILAVEVGMGVAALLALRNIARSATAVETPVGDGPDGGRPDSAGVDPDGLDADGEHGLLRERIVAYRMDGALFFGAAQKFLTDLTNVTDVRVVILRMPELQVLDATGAQALGQIVAELEDRHITVLIKGLHPEHERVLRAVGALDHLAHEEHLFDALGEAIAHARAHAERVAPAGAP